MIIKILSNYKKWLNKKKCSLKIGACENSNSFMMLLSFAKKTRIYYIKVQIKFQYFRIQILHIGKLIIVYDITYV